MLTTLDIDDYDLSEAREVAATFGTGRYGYIVTPNVDHVIRHYDDAHFRTLYSHAAVVLLDSRWLAGMLAVFKRQKLKTCLGSDLTAELFANVIYKQDRIILVGSTAEQAQQLRDQYGLQKLLHIDPPMNFVANPAAIEACLQQIEAIGTFRFCFLAVGSPQQEVIAHQLRERGIAKGLALCVGASVDFITGKERRAPQWMRALALEWLHRLIQNPRRMAKRYLIRDPRIFLLLPFIQLRIRSPVVTAAMRNAATLPRMDPVEPSQGKTICPPQASVRVTMIAGRIQQL